MDDLFVPEEFDVPETLRGPGFRLEPLGPEHNERDHVAWMTSIEHIRSSPGFDSPTGRWPAEMSLEENLDDLVGHATDFSERRGFTYSILDGDEVIGCVYIYPSRKEGYDADIRSWVRQSRSGIDKPVREALSSWIATTWPFSNPLYHGA